MAHNQLFTLCLESGSALQAFETLYQQTSARMVHDGALSPTEQQWLGACCQIALDCAWVVCAHQQLMHTHKGRALQPYSVLMCAHDLDALSAVLRVLTRNHAIEHPAIYRLVTDFEEMPNSVRLPMLNVMDRILTRCQQLFDAQRQSQIPPEQHP